MVRYICPVCDSELKGHYCPVCKKRIKEPVRFTGECLPNEHSNRCYVPPNRSKKETPRANVPRPYTTARSAHTAPGRTHPVWENANRAGQSGRTAAGAGGSYSGGSPYRSNGEVPKKKITGATVVVAVIIIWILLIFAINMITSLVSHGMGSFGASAETSAAVTDTITFPFPVEGVEEDDYISYTLTDEQVMALGEPSNRLSFYEIDGREAVSQITAILKERGQSVVSESVSSHNMVIKYKEDGSFSSTYRTNTYLYLDNQLDQIAVDTETFTGKLTGVSISIQDREKAEELFLALAEYITGDAFDEIQRQDISEQFAACRSGSQYVFIYLGESELYYSYNKDGSDYYSITHK